MENFILFLIASILWCGIIGIVLVVHRGKEKHMAKITIKYRKRNEPVKDALQLQTYARTYEGAVALFRERHPVAEYNVVNPEEKAGEYFVGNLSDIAREETERELREHQITYRIGEQAYDLDGNPLSSWHHPLFIAQSDVVKYDRMMEKK